MAHLDQFHDPTAIDGAVDIEACPFFADRKRTCRCEPCARCGNRKHTAVHGPFAGEPPGSKPWGHRFVEREFKAGK